MANPKYLRRPRVNPNEHIQTAIHALVAALRSPKATTKREYVVQAKAALKLALEAIPK